MSRENRKGGRAQEPAVLKFRSGIAPKKRPDWIQAQAERLEQETHDLACEAWATWLAEILPVDHTDPPLPPHPTDALPGSEAKIQVARERVERGFRALHPLDPQWESCDRLGRRVQVARNGSTESNGLAVLGLEDDEPGLGNEYVVYAVGRKGMATVDDPPFDNSRESAVRWAHLLRMRRDLREVRVVTVKEGRELLKPAAERKVA